MSISDTTKIAIVATRPGSSLVNLVITDHLSWDQFDHHAKLLQDKLNTHLEFVETGQLQRVSNPSIPKSPQVRITLAVLYAPSSVADAFLNEVKTLLAQSKIEFVVEFRGDDVS